MTWSELVAKRHEPWAWVTLQVLIVATAVLTYFGVRGLTEASLDPARRHARMVVDLEQRLHVGVETRVQHPLRSSETLATLANWIYIWGHWPVLVVTMAWLLWRHRSVFLRMRNAMLVSGAIGLVVFVVFPTAPPRLAGMGYLDTVTERSESYRYLQPPAFVDQYAAVPSLHVGWDLLACVAICSATTWWPLRVAACSLPVLMSWSVVASGNHFVLDVVAGVACVLVGHVVALAHERRVGRRRRASRRGRPPAGTRGQTVGRGPEPSPVPSPGPSPVPSPYAAPDQGRRPP